MRAYSAPITLTNTASATVPMTSFVGATTVRPKIYDLIITADGVAPNDYQVHYQLQRGSARGTSSATLTPSPLDSNDPACTTIQDTGWSVAPTLTSNVFLLDIGHNMRVPVRWVAQADDMALTIPATSGALIAIMSKAVSTAFADVLQTYFKE